MMNLGNKTNNGSTFLKLGMLFLVLAILSVWFVRPTAHLSQDVADMLKGFLFGISIAFNLGAVYFNRRCKRGEAA